MGVNNREMKACWHRLVMAASRSVSAKQAMANTGTEEDQNRLTDARDRLWTARELMAIANVNRFPA